MGLKSTVAKTRTPTSNPTAKPSVKPTAIKTVTPTSAIVTGNPTTKTPEERTARPTAGSINVDASGETENVLNTLTGLQMGMAGITELSKSAQLTWQDLTESFSTSFVFNDLKDSVSNFETTYEVTNTSLITLQRHQRMLRGEQRGLQNNQQGIIVEYTQTLKYDTIDANKFTSDFIATAPFEADEERTAYVTLLGTSDDEILSRVTGVSEIELPDMTPTMFPDSSTTMAPSTAPSKKSLILTKPAIIGIACGGAGLLILLVLFCVYCRDGGGKEEEGGAKNNGEPPLHVSVKDDEVSTLAVPQSGPPTYGDQSVATMDYDYSKAYGGAGDTSVSSAGGISNTQNLSLSANGAAGGAALGALDDSASYDAQYNGPRANVKEEVIHIFAPPGKLGVVIDTPDDGAPVVHAVKDTSVIADRIMVGDKLVAVDDEDVRSMTAIKVSKMISRKGANPSRKLTIIRTAPIEE